LGVPRFEGGRWIDSVEAVETASGRVGLLGEDMMKLFYERRADELGSLELRRAFGED
jgi:hypothetical protein